MGSRLPALTLFGAILLAAGCGSSGEGDRGTDAAVDSSITPEPALDAGPDAAVCEVGEGPLLPPALTSEVVVIPAGGSPDAGAPADAAADADAGDGGDSAPDAATPIGPPASLGGDETGVWVYEKVTLYVPASLLGGLDPRSLVITGSGWLELGGGRFRQAADLRVVLPVPVGGNNTGSAFKAKGTYGKTGPTNLTYAAECTEGSPLTSQSFEYTRRSPTSLELVTRLSFAGQSLTVQIDLGRR